MAIGNIVHAVLLDLSEAFDSHSHQLFLELFQSVIFLPSAIQTVERVCNRSTATSVCKWCSI